MCCGWELIMYVLRVGAHNVCAAGVRAHNVCAVGVSS